MATEFRYDRSRWTLGQLIEERADELPDHTVFRLESCDLSYAQLCRDGRRLASALAARGIGAGDSVAVLSEVSASSLTAWSGLAMGGLIEVPLHPALRGDSLTYQINIGGCRAIIISARLFDRLPPLAAMPTVEWVIVTESSEDPCVEPAATAIEFNELLSEGFDKPLRSSVRPLDLSTICFTSGTSGPPKGVELCHNATIKLAFDVADAMEYEPSDFILSYFPFSHVNARYCAALPAILRNACTVFRNSFSVTRFWELCRAEGITAFNYLGGVPKMLLSQSLLANDRSHAVRRAYGAGSSRQTIEEFQDRFGVTLVDVYGSTEMGLMCASTLRDRKPGSCGKPVAELEIALHDEAGWPVPVGSVGEVVVRPREPDIVTSGYYRDPEATVRAFRGLWFHTGDRCRMDEDGWYYFVDRIKDGIRRRGENISSWEIEQAALSHPAIAEAAAIGVPSPEVEDGEEEVLLAVVALSPPPSPTELLDHCSSRLPYYAVPRYIRFLDSLPRNLSSRIVKNELRDAGVRGDTWDRDASGYQVKR